MKKTLRVDIANQTFYPDVLSLLRRIPNSSLFHTKHSFRHPAAIYLLSLIQLASDFDRLLKNYAAIRNSQGKSNLLHEQIAQSQRILIYSMREHIDDCQMILMCLVDPDRFSPQGKSPDDFLKAAGFTEQKLFWNGVCSYMNSYLIPLVNKLKHSQGRIRTLVIECPGNDFRPGFYLEEVIGTEIAQPSQELHKGYSAFSFAKDIRSNLALVFRASQSLQEAIEAFVKRSRITLLPGGNDPSTPGIWREVCCNVAQLDIGIFPNEVKSRFYRVDIQSAGEFRIREIERDQKLIFPKGNIKFKVNETIDGMTKSYQLPTFKRWL
jgi:hypothetical protein